MESYINTKPPQGKYLSPSVFSYFPYFSLLLISSHPIPKSIIHTHPKTITKRIIQNTNNKEARSQTETKALGTSTTIEAPNTLVDDGSAHDAYKLLEGTYIVEDDSHTSSFLGHCTCCCKDCSNRHHEGNQKVHPSCVFLLRYTKHTQPSQQGQMINKMPCLSLSSLLRKNS